MNKFDKNSQMKFKLNIEICAGGIISKLNKKTKKINILLVHTKSYNGYWGFPKGHVELNETLIQTAIREIKEETGLDVTLVDENLKWVSEYSPFLNTKKIVTYFWFYPNLLSKLKPQISEISEILWVDIDHVNKKLTYKNDQKIFADFISNKNVINVLRKMKQ